MMRFFEPTPVFLDWLANHAGNRVVFDVGCGQGHIVKALRRRQVKVLGLDPRWSWTQQRDLDLLSCILPFKAQKCPLLLSTPDSLVLFCRPCHDGFVAETIALLPATAEPLYISKPDNIPLDLPDLDVQTLKTPPCREEVVVRVLRNEQGKRSTA